MVGNSTSAREKLAGRLGFILLSAGCAIGIGNVWRFPYVAGSSGGGWFVLLYLLCLALIGIPVLVMEFAAGRASGHSIAKLHSSLTPDKPLWRLHGLAGFIGLNVLMMFYTVVTGWMLIYFLRSTDSVFASLDANGVAAAFVAMLSAPLPQICAATFVCIVSAVICAIGLQKGLERVTKWIMLALLLLIVVLAVHSMTLDGAADGIRFFLVPDFSRMREIGIGNVCANAMNQAFFTLSLGIGSMAVFGSYINRSRTLLGEAVNVTLLDTFVAICAGLIVIPACFAFGIAPGQGPGLVFVTLPNVFNQMPGGRLWGALFFLFMSFAALTTVLAVFEGIVAGIMDYTGISRRRACLILGLLMPLLSVPCVLGFNVWNGFHPIGSGSTVLDLEDFIVSNLFLPFGGLAFVLYCAHRFGWGWKGFVDEANTGKGPHFPASFRFYCRWLLPLIIFIIAILAFRQTFAAEIETDEELHARLAKLCPPRPETAAKFEGESAYPKAARPYRESAKAAFEYMTSLPAMKVLVETGDIDNRYQHNAYPSKTHAAHINAMLNYAELDPAASGKAMRFAKASADYIVSQLEPAGAPLEFWPPTYGRKPLRFDPATDGPAKGNEMVGNEPAGAVKYRGEVMLVYPAEVALALVRYGEVVKERKWVDIAGKIAATYLKLRRADGSWPLKLKLATGEVVCANPLVSLRPLEMFEALANATGEKRWRDAAENAFAWQEAHPLSDWNWDGQFEDIRPAAPYTNPTKHNAIDSMMYILRRFPNDPTRLRQARNLIRFCEDRFVCWRQPKNHPNWEAPSVLEQYSCFCPIDASACKMIRGYVAIYRASGDKDYLAKAKVLANTITRMQKPSGRIPTFWTGDWAATERYDWLNCMAASANALMILSAALAD